MSTIGKANDIFVPKITLAGKNITSFAIDLPVGQMAGGSVGLPPEELSVFFGEAVDHRLDLMVNGVKLFSGFCAGVRGEGNGDSFNFGANLIHAARTLDGGRLFAPGVYPTSTDDYTFTLGNSSDTNDDPLMDARLVDFNLTGNIVDEVKKYLITVMSKLDAAPDPEGLEQYAEMVGNVKDLNSEAVAALGEIQAIGACTLGLGGDLNPGVANAAQLYMNRIVCNSVTAHKSTWDVLAAVYSGFGLNVICFPDGTVRVAPDFSGCKPPEANTIRGTIHTGFQAQAGFTRTPMGCIVLSHGLDPGDGGVGADGSTVGASATKLGAWAPKDSKKHRGGWFVTGLPAWMVPGQQAGEIPEIPEKVVTAYAQQLYYEVANMGRTWVVSTPLNDRAVPGTTYYFEPLSNAVFYSGGKLPFRPRYAGFCHKISHTANASGSDFNTHFHFRNIYADNEFGDMLDGAALFGGQKPFEI